MEREGNFIGRMKMSILDSSLQMVNLKLHTHASEDNELII